MDKNECLSYGRSIKHLSKAIGCLANANLEACGITGEQCRIITYVYVSELEGKTVFQKDFENEFGVKRSSITSILANIEKNGYIYRCGDDSDARIKKIHITEKGSRLAVLLKDYIDKLEAEIVRDMDENEREMFLKLIRRAIVNVETSVLADGIDIDLHDV
ncbi:MAG: MarR family winged helix-turn-helix transcriptional regulator [Huintestinicola sp.]